jgi:hypothetical protein
MPSGFLLRLLASQITALEFFGCQMIFELDSPVHDEFLLDLSCFCNLVLGLIQNFVSNHATGI